MTLTRWKPFGELASLHDKINRLFEDRYYRRANQDVESDEAVHDVSRWSPVTDIFETEKDYVFKVELPGLSKEDVNVELNGNTLSIKGELEEEKEVKKENYHRIESVSGVFSRNFALPRDVDVENIKANMKDGILELRVGKQEEKRKKEISISVS